MPILSDLVIAEPAANIAALPTPTAVGTTAFVLDVGNGQPGTVYWNGTVWGLVPQSLSFATKLLADTACEAMGGLGVPDGTIINVQNDPLIYRYYAPRTYLSSTGYSGAYNNIQNPLAFIGPSGILTATSNVITGMTNPNVSYIQSLLDTGLTVFVRSASLPGGGAAPTATVTVESTDTVANTVTLSRAAVASNTEFIRFTTVDTSSFYPDNNNSSYINYTDSSDNISQWTFMYNLQGWLILPSVPNVLSVSTVTQLSAVLDANLPNGTVYYMGTPPTVSGVTFTAPIKYTLNANDNSSTVDGVRVLATQSGSGRWKADNMYYAFTSSVSNALTTTQPMTGSINGNMNNLYMGNFTGTSALGGGFINCTIPTFITPVNLQNITGPVLSNGIIRQVGSYQVTTGNAVSVADFNPTTGAAVSFPPSVVIGINSASISYQLF